MDNKLRNPFRGAIGIFIETLTGTCFELRVSPYETILSIKAKIQRLEGIPVAQQHLIWEGTELEDDFCLHDYSIKNDCTLRLVLALRGGPVNTRRITVDDPSFLDVADYIEASQEELLEELSVSANMGKTERDSQVTLLVYRNGDQINFFRVVDGEDGPLTPLSGSLRERSYSEMEKVDSSRNKQKFSTSRLSENRITASKMKHLQNRMHLLKLRENAPSKTLPPKPEVTSTETKSSCGKDKTGPESREPHDSKENVGLTAVVNKPEIGHCRSLRSDRLLKVLNDQRPIVPSASSQSKNVASLTKPSRLPHDLCSKISFNRHDMYLRSYGLLPLQRRTQEEVNDTQESGNQRALDGAAEGSRGDAAQNSDISSSHIWCKHSITPTHGHKEVAIPQSCPYFVKDKSKRSSDIAHCFQNASSGISLPPDSHLPPLIANPHALVKKATSAIGVATMADRSFKRTSQVPSDQANFRVDRLMSDDRHSTPSDIEGKETWGPGCGGVVESTPSTDSVRENLLQRKLSANLLNSRSDHNKEHLCGSAKRRTRLTPDHNAKRCEVNLSAGIDRLRMVPCYSRHASRCPSSNLLPPVRPVVIKKKCFCCGKKTGLATSYVCRCGKNFCATHRYAETHDCTFDYKSLGRQLLKESNPIVSAPKLPKI